MLALRNVHQTFHAGEVNEVQALRGVDLQLATGEFVTVIGSNGAGKSTLFNVIAGIFGPTQGQILIDGVDVTLWPETSPCGADWSGLSGSAVGHRGLDDHCTKSYIGFLAQPTVGLAYRRQS
ncbi:MAG: ATP-binding cassette domain-containing protein [Caldilineaceae bacterium]